MNCKGKRTVGKANEGINVEKIIIGLKKLKIKIKTREKKKTGRRKKERKTQSCKSAMSRQRFITRIKNMTDFKGAQTLNQI